MADNRLMTFLKTGSLVEVMFRTHAICCSGSFKAASLTRIIVCRVAWFRKAAEQGDAKAQFMLGMMYFNGRGVAQDYKLAYVWSSVSAANGHVEAATNRDLFAKRLSPAVLAEAQALAGQYVELYQPKQ